MAVMVDPSPAVVAAAASVATAAVLVVTAVVVEAASLIEAVVVDFHINEVEELAVITIVDSVECVMCVNPSFIMRTRVQFELHSLETIQLLSMFSISQMRLNRMKR